MKTYRIAIYVEVKAEDAQAPYDMGVNLAEHVADTFNDDGSLDAVWFDPGTITEVKEA